MVANSFATDSHFVFSSSQSKMNFPSELIRPIEFWDKNDVQKWIDFAIDEYSLSNIRRTDFQMNGKALLLLNETSFQQRAGRSGDVLFKALQQHHSMIKSSNSQGEHFRSISTLTPHLWNHLTSSIVNPRAHFNLPLVLPAPTPLSMPSFSTIRPPQSAFDYLVHRPTSIERSMLLPMPESIEIQRTNSPNDQTRQIRFYNDRVDFRGDVIFKPVRAKNCRILWEFLYILLEDRQYESIIQWENRNERVFRIVQADKLAALWGLQKNRLSMTYEKLSRGMRYYYANNIISKEQSKRLLYRFMRSPEEIRNSLKRQTTGSTSMLENFLKKNRSNDVDAERLAKIPPEYFQFLTDFSPSTISKSDRSTSSSPESFESLSPTPSSSSSSTKRKQSTPMSLTARFSPNDS